MQGTFYLILIILFILLTSFSKGSVLKQLTSTVDREVTCEQPRHKQTPPQGNYPPPQGIYPSNQSINQS